MTFSELFILLFSIAYPQSYAMFYHKFKYNLIILRYSKKQISNAVEEEEKMCPRARWTMITSRVSDRTNFVAHCFSVAYSMPNILKNLNFWSQIFVSRVSDPTHSETFSSSIGSNTALEQSKSLFPGLHTRLCTVD